LDDAVRANDLKTAQYYRGRLARAIEHAAKDDPAKSLHDALKELFEISGFWVRNVGTRQDAKRHILELIDRIIPLLNA
jgi:hypothetical protein